MSTLQEDIRSQVLPAEAIKTLQLNCAQMSRIVTESVDMETDAIPQKLPAPWLADSEWLLAELTKTRETILRIPLQLAIATDIQSAIDRVWRLEQNLRYLLHLHREGQRSFAKQQSISQAPKKRTRKAAKSNIVRISA